MGILKKMFGGGNPPPAPAPTPAPAPATIREISAEDLKSRLGRGEDVVVVDMRQPWEYESGHISRAIHMFANDIPGRMNELPRDKDVVFQCWHGNTSRGAAMYLVENGWPAERIASLIGGISGWLDSHGPASLVKDANP